MSIIALPAPVATGLKLFQGQHDTRAAVVQGKEVFLKVKKFGRVRQWTCLAITSLAMVAGGCAGGAHGEGEHQLMLTGFFSHPFDADGRGDCAGATVGYNYSLPIVWP